jgi:hypothetical protein
MRTPKNLNPEDPRRRWLVKALASGLFTLPFAARSQATSPARSIHRWSGLVTINGSAAKAGTSITANDTIETGPGAELVFTVSDDAFLVRGATRVELSGAQEGVEALRVLTGKLLSVFGKRPHRVTTGVATIGIRGTGLYVEAEPDQTYVCTCYGTTELAAIHDPAAAETIQSTHHDAPRYILAGGQGAEAIRAAPVKDHTDEELTMLEALVGREPPWGPDGYDERPRRRRY